MVFIGEDQEAHYGLYMGYRLQFIPTSTYQNKRRKRENREQT